MMMMMMMIDTRVGQTIDVGGTRQRVYKRADQRTAKRIFARATQVSLLTIMIGLPIVLVGPTVAISQAVQLVRVDLAVVGQGYRASKMIGSNVTNDKSENIGTLDDIIIDKKSVDYAVLQVGGFLGVGGHLVVVPYESLKIDDSGKKIELPGASKDELKKLAEFKYPPRE